LSPARDRSRQISFIADEDVFEYLEGCQSKTGAINAAVRAMARAQGAEKTLEERVQILEKEVASLKRKSESK
jgi:uncharacterized protein YceH (UPF0502 family)